MAVRTRRVWRVSTGTLITVWIFVALAVVTLVAAVRQHLAQLRQATDD